MRRNLSIFLKDNSGLAALELGLITPVLLAALIAGANIAFSILQEEKISAAAYAGVNFLQDQVAAGALDGVRPSTDPNTGEQQDGQLVETAKLIIQDAHGGDIDVSSIIIETYCGCPQKNSDFRNGFDEAKPFYQRSGMSTSRSQDLCPVRCSDSTQSRIVVEIDIEHVGRNLFGGEYKVAEHMVTRLR